MVRSIFRRKKSNNGSLDFENRPILWGIGSAHADRLGVKNEKTKYGTTVVSINRTRFSRYTIDSFSKSPKGDLPGVVCKCRPLNL